jgi:hypothetical protein
MLPRELKQRDENTELKRLVADLSLDSVILQDIVQKQLPRAFASWCNDEPTRWPLAPHDRGDQSRQADRSVLYLSPRHDRLDLVLPMSAGRASQVRKPIKELKMSQNDPKERTTISVPATTKPGGQPGQRPKASTPRPPNKAGQGQYHRKDANNGARPTEEHGGATEDEVGDRTGPGAGYDNEPGTVKDKGGVS